MTLAVVPPRGSRVSPLSLAGGLHELASSLDHETVPRRGERGPAGIISAINQFLPSTLPPPSVIAVDTIWTLNDTDWNHPAHTLPQTPPRYGLLTYNYIPCNSPHDVE